MRASRVCRSCLVTGVLALAAIGLASCSLSGKKYVDRSIGFAVTRGEVIRLENLNAERKEHLSDGIALRIAQRGCRVSLRMGRPVQVIEMKPGSILVLSESDDYVLDPYALSDQAVDGETTVPGPVGPAADRGGVVGPPVAGR